jgi:transposase
LPALAQTHRAYVRTVDEALARLETVDAELRELLTIEPLRTRVVRLRCFRGIDDLTALTIAAELGDARRFPSASCVMAFTGLVPSEHSSGTKHARGAITKTGNAIYAASSSNPPGSTAITHFSVARCARANAGRRSTPSTARGTRNNASVVAIADSPRAASRNNTSSPPSPASSPASSGPP